MEAFEKHLAEDYLHVRPTSVDAEIMRQEWRAALEWFYSKLGYSEEHEELKDFIEKELEN